MLMIRKGRRLVVCRREWVVKKTAQIPQNNCKHLMEGFVRFFFPETAVKIKMLNVEKLSEIRTRSPRDPHEMRENLFYCKNVKI